MKKITRILAFVLVMVLMCTNCVSAFAADTVQNTEYDSTGILNWDFEESNEECEVECTVGSEFVVTIPKKITLDGSTKVGAYQVSVSGDIAGNQYVGIEPDTEFVMYEAGHKAPANATVTQAVTKFYAADLVANAVENGTVVAAISAGTWTGKFNFTISLNGQVITNEEQRVRDQVEVAAALVNIEDIADAITEITANDLEGARESLTALFSSKASENGCTATVLIDAFDAPTVASDGACSYRVKLSKGRISYTMSDARQIAVKYDAAGNDNEPIVDPETPVATPVVGVTTIDEGFPGIYDEDGIMTMTWEGLTEKYNNFVAYAGEDVMLTAEYAPNGYPLTWISWRTEDGTQSIYKEEGILVVPDNVTKIAIAAFRSSYFYDIRLGSSVKTIDEYAFAGAETLLVTLPDDIETIASRAFFETHILTVTYKGIEYDTSESTAELRAALTANGCSVADDAFTLSYPDNDIAY